MLRDLRAELEQWRHEGERLLLAIDANEDTMKGRLLEMVSGLDLNMREVVQAKHSSLPITATLEIGVGPNQWSFCDAGYFNQNGNVAGLPQIHWRSPDVCD